MTHPLIGQEQAEAALARAIATNRVSHAYLFVGPESVGKQTAALRFAQALNCRDLERLTTEDTETRRGHGEGLGLPFAEIDLTEVDGSAIGTLQDTSVESPCLRVLRGELLTLRPCGECEECRRIAAGTHPDVHVILAGSKTGQNISVEQMRDLRQDVARRPIMGRRKVYLIPAAEAMNDEAANTLLKTLEEPPEYVTLILMATSPTRVLPTILSRCLVVRFRLAPEAAIREWLAADGVPGETAAALALTAGGRPGLARRWIEEPGVLERRRQALDLLAEIAELRQRARSAPAESIAALRLAERARSLIDSAEGAPIGEGAPRRGRKAVAEPAAGDRTAADGASERTAAKAGSLRLLELARSYYRDLLLLAQGAPEALVLNGDALPALREAVAGHTPAELVAALTAVDRCQQFLERNVAPQLALESLFLALIGSDR